MGGVVGSSAPPRPRAPGSAVPKPAPGRAASPAPKAVRAARTAIRVASAARTASLSRSMPPKAAQLVQDSNETSGRAICRQDSASGAADGLLGERVVLNGLSQTRTEEDQHQHAKQGSGSCNGTRTLGRILQTSRNTVNQTSTRHYCCSKQPSQMIHTCTHLTDSLIIQGMGQPNPPYAKTHIT